MSASVRRPSRGGFCFLVLLRKHADKLGQWRLRSSGDAGGKPRRGRASSPTHLLSPPEEEQRGRRLEPGKWGKPKSVALFAPGTPRSQCAVLSSREPSGLNSGSLLGAPRLLSCHSWNAWRARRPPVQAWVATAGRREAPLWVPSSHSAGPLYQSLSLTPTGSGPGLPTGCTLPAPVPRL